MSGEDLANEGPRRPDDAAWLDGVLKELPTVPVSAALESRILGAFDARRRDGGMAGRLAARLRDAIWPGVPAWQPAAVLAISLAIGVAAGTFLPFEDMAPDSAEQTASVALDAPPAFDLGENS